MVVAATMLITLLKVPVPVVVPPIVTFTFEVAAIWICPFEFKLAVALSPLTPLIAVRKVWTVSPLTAV